MKTPRDFLNEVAELQRGHTGNCQDFTELRLLPAITARDDEHRAELDEARKLADTLERIIDTERQVRKEAENTLFFVRKDLQKTKGELAAAQCTIEQLGKDGAAIAAKLDRAVGLLTSSVMGHPHGAGCDCAAHDFLRALSAPPPVPRTCTASAGSCNSPAACGEAGKCIDARMRAFLVPPAESTPVQREAIGVLPRGTVAGHQVTQLEPAPPDDIRERQRIAHHSPKVFRATLDDHEERLAALEAHVHCRACGFVLRLENALVADGCPCNSGRGVNHGIVARNTCTCVVCDPAQTGSVRKVAALEATTWTPKEVEESFERLLDRPMPPAALEAKGEPGTHAFVPGRFHDYCMHLVDGDYCKKRETAPLHTKGAKP